MAIEYFCPAKVNLALSVGSASPAWNYFHPIASWMLAVDFGDRLWLEKTAGTTSRFDLSFSKQCPRAGKVDWPLEKDLCFRAHRMLEEKCGRKLGIALKLEKQVPAGAGMGGGSSDAAFTLVGINEIYGLGLSKEALRQMGLQLGSDVPFFVDVAGGCDSALVTGVGSGMSELKFAGAIDLVLVFPAFGTPTGPVYKAFDELTKDQGERLPQEDRIIKLARQQRLVDAELFNDLAVPACRVVKELEICRQQVVGVTGKTVHVTGSGSTLFVVVATVEQANALAEKIEKETGLAARAVKRWKK